MFLVQGDQANSYSAMKQHFTSIYLDAAYSAVLRRNMILRLQFEEKVGMAHISGPGSLCQG